MKTNHFAATAILALSFNACSSFDVKTDSFDGSKIIEYSTFTTAKGDSSALHYFESKFQKKIKNGKEVHLKLYIELAGSYGGAPVDPKVTFRIDGKDDTLDVGQNASKNTQLVKIDKGGMAQGAGATFTSSGEIDLLPIRAKLATAKTVLVRFQRQGTSAVFEYSESELEKIRTLLEHTGE